MIKFLPLGGVGQIGGNFSYFEIEGVPFIVDAGILFPREESLGIEYLLPDISTLKNLNQPKFLLLTHVHEDHVGGLRQIIKDFPKVPIVCSSYSRTFLSKKIPHLTNKTIHYKDFNLIPLDFFKLRHSIPGVIGFHYSSKKLDTSFLFCTDFRFNNSEKSDSYFLSIQKIKQYSKQSSHRLLFVDSTNIASSTQKGLFEEDIYNALEAHVKTATQDCYVTLFPSNVERLGSIIKIANMLGRPVALAGQSVNFHYSLGLECGFIQPIDKKEYVKSKSVIILSGSQGDLRGAFRRVFTGNDKSYKPQKGDSLLYSSKVIPGNEKNVIDIFNKASLLGVYVINEGNIHVSGHAYSEEIEQIIEHYKPQKTIPIHLESLFFQNFNDKFGKRTEVLRIDNFKELIISNDSHCEISQFEEKDFQIVIEGGSIVEKSLINERRRLGNNGVLFISIYKEKQEISFSSYGIPTDNPNLVTNKTKELLLSEWTSPEMNEKIRVGLRHYFQKTYGFKPQIFVHIF